MGLPVNLIVWGVEKSHVVLDVGSVIVMANAEEMRLSAGKTEKKRILDTALDSLASAD